MESLKICFKPYKYRETSSGFILGNDMEDDVFYDLGSYYEQEIHDFLERIWFEIIGYSKEGEQIHIGYITGYFINLDYIDMQYYDFENPDYSGINNPYVAMTFDDTSHLTLRLWEHIHNKEFVSNFYFLNSITLDKKYRTSEIEKLCIEHLPTALYELFEFEIGTIFYSVNATDVSDDTIQKISELEDKRSRKNFKAMGFKEIYIDDSNTKVESDIEIWVKKL